MAIIKKLKRLGSTVRGATLDRVCTLDKDGNVINSSKRLSMIPGNPAANQKGKVWTATGANTAAWVDVPTVSDGTFTPAEGIVSNLTIVKYGRIVFISGSITNNTETATGTNVTLGSLSANLFPVDTCYIASYGSNYYIATYGSVISQAALGAGVTRYITLMFISNN